MLLIFGPAVVTGFPFGTQWVVRSKLSYDDEDDSLAH